MAQCISNQHSNEDGTILVTVLLILLVMQALGVGFLTMATQQRDVAVYHQDYARTLHAAESCTQEAVAWLENFEQPPTILPHSISVNSLTHLADENDPPSTVTQLANYSYDCTVIDQGVKNAPAGGNEGGEVGVSTGYGLAGYLNPSYYYTVIASGYGPGNAKRVLNTLVSMEY